MRRSLQLAVLLAGLGLVLAGGAGQISAASGPSHDNDVWWDGLGHDSRSPIYRQPMGAVTAGTKITLRFRSFHDDLTGVTVRVWSTAKGAQQLVDMSRVASGVPCYQQLGFSCDFWEATIDAGDPGTLYYRFIAKDGSKTVFYEEHSDVRDGGWGKPYDASPDWGWAITVYDPKFEPIKWAENAMIYQIFPDRFRDANRKNDPAQGDPKKYVWSKDKRYAYPHGDPQHESTPALDRIVRMPWGALPEGYCRNYADALTTCHKRFPPDKSVGTEGPHGRDYYGGDLQGITQKLSYLKGLGINVIYLNPIFWAGSNHRYDTRDYTKIDPMLGTTKDFTTMVKTAHKLGMKVVLDGVFNHMSSDSPFFDRYHNWPGKGACESDSSKWRGWFTFRVPAQGEPSPCAGGQPGETYYNSWAGFDSLPQLTESLGVKEYIYDLANSAAKKWLKLGADGWRLDVMQEKSADFWHGFRAAVKGTKPDAIIIGELWKKFDVLPYVNGDTADTAMDYRFRDAVISLLAPHPFDSKGFPGSGQPISPSEFVDRMESIREDYPAATYDTLMNLIDSHDTERALWTLTPGAATRGARELDATNLAEGKARLKLAALIQMTMPGAPTIYYGDEVGLTGDTDPDDRRTYPWGDSQARGWGDTRKPDTALRAYYKTIAAMRNKNEVLRTGSLRFLAAYDSSKIVAYGRKLGDSAAVVILHAADSVLSDVHIPVAGYLPDGTILDDGSTVHNGEIVTSVLPLGGKVLFTKNGDLTAPSAPRGLTATADGLAVQLSWEVQTTTDTAPRYNVYRSPLSGGGYTKLNSSPVTGTSFHDPGADILSGQTYYYVVKALDSVGNESDASNEVSVVPGYPIAAVTLDRPATLDYTVSAKFRTDPVYGRILITGVTSQAGQTPGVLAQLCYGTVPTCVDMTYSGDAGETDEYGGTLQPDTPGTYSYFVRFSTTGGRSWVQSSTTGTLTVHPNPDQTPPAAPTGLAARSRGAASIGLTWTAVSAADLYGYDVFRSTTSGSGYVKVGSTDAATTKFTDTGLDTGTTYFYVVKAFDEAGNRSAASNEASAAPSALQVDVTFVVTPPASTPASATLYIAGNQPQICNWCNQHTVALTKGDDGKWRITIGFAEGTSVEYKYTLGTWTNVEKGAQCDEIANRSAKVAPEGDSDSMTVNDTVKNWRNVAPCGDRRGR